MYCSEINLNSSMDAYSYWRMTRGKVSEQSTSLPHRGVYFTRGIMHHAHYGWFLIVGDGSWWGRLIPHDGGLIITPLISIRRMNSHGVWILAWHRPAVVERSEIKYLARSSQLRPTAAQKHNFGRTAGRRRIKTQKSGQTTGLKQWLASDPEIWFQLWTTQIRMCSTWYTVLVLASCVLAAGL